MDEVKVNELIIKANDNVTVNDRVVIEDEDGTKTAMLSSIQLLMTKTTVYLSFDNLKNGILNGNVSNGVLCHTLGYHTINDNGGGMYLITTDTELMDPKIDTIITIPDTGVEYAIILLSENDGYVTVEQFGAYGDGKIDDTKAIKAALESGYKIRFRSNATYKMREPIVLKNNMDLDFNGATLLFQGCNGFITDSEESLTNVSISNLTINAIDTRTCINISNHIDNLIIDSMVINNYKSNAIVITSMNQCRITNISLFASNDALTPVAISYGAYNLETDIFGPITDGTLYFNNILINRACPAFDIKYSKGNIININNIHYTGILGNSSSNLISATHSQGTGDINISTAIIRNAAYGIFTTSPGNMTLKDIYIIDSLGFLDQVSPKSKISLNGHISISTSDDTEKKAVYNHIHGSIKFNADLEYDDNYRLMHVIENSDGNYVLRSAQYGGNLIDNTHPSLREQNSKNYEDWIAIKDSSTLEVRSDHNTKMIIDSEDNLKEIINIKAGLHGQIIQLCSDRLIEIIPSYTIKLANTNKRVFIGTGESTINDDSYKIDIDNNVTSNEVFGTNLKKRVKAYARPLTTDTMEVYIQFIDRDGLGFGNVKDNTKSHIGLTIESTKMGTNEITTVNKSIKLDELIWENDSIEPSVKNSQKILLIESVNKNDIDSINITVNCDNLYIDESPIGITNISLFPKHIFGNFVFYPAGILLQKSSEHSWCEI